MKTNISTKLLWLALGAFAIGTEGYAIAGLLPTIANDVHVSVAVAGQLITAFALAFALGSPLLAVATGGLERKRLLLVAIGVFGVFNVLAAFAHTYALLFAARIGLALAAGTFMPAASAYAVAISPPERRGRALAIIYVGLTVATLVGVPLGVLVGERFGWRCIFLGAAGLSFTTMLGIAFALVPSSGARSATLAERFAVARRPDVLGVLLVTIFFMAGAFSIYTYIAPFLQTSSHLSGNAVAIVLFLFGLGATVGNLAGGALADRVGPPRVLKTVLFGLAVLFSALSLAALVFPPEIARWIVVPIIGLWGLVGFSAPSAQQSRLAAIDPRLAPVTLSLNASAGYIGVSLGAVIGSVAVAHHVIADVGWLGAVSELIALCILIFSLRSRTGFNGGSRAEEIGPLSPVINQS